MKRWLCPLYQNVLPELLTLSFYFQRRVVEDCLSPFSSKDLSRVAKVFQPSSINNYGPLRRAAWSLEDLGVVSEGRIHGCEQQGVVISGNGNLRQRWPLTVLINLFGEIKLIKGNSGHGTGILRCLRPSNEANGFFPSPRSWANNFRPRVRHFLRGKNRESRARICWSLSSPCAGVCNGVTSCVASGRSYLQI